MVEVRRWAYIAGASGGIGRAISDQLARDGWNIAVGFHSNEAGAEDTAEIVRAHGGEAELVRADLADSHQTQEGIDKLFSDRALHGVVCAAGPHLHQRFISQQSPEVFGATIDADLKGFYNLAFATLDRMRESQGAYLAMVTPALRRYAKADILSAGPKAGVEILVKGLAVEEGRFGVRANAIGPGVVEGEGMWGKLMENGDYTESGLEKAKQHTPLRRFGTVEDIAHAASFLMSDHANWITGQTLFVDGGYSVA